MADYDIVNPYGNSFRAKLAAAWDATNKRKVYAVGLDANGKVVKGAGVTGIRGLVVITRAMKANEVVDVMKRGEMVSFGPTAGTPDEDYGVAGTDYYANATTGVVTATPSAGGTYVGHTVEADRLIVDVDSSVSDSRPVGLSSTAKAATTVTLVWASVTGATGYKTQKSTDGGSTWAATTVQPAGTATTVTETGLTTATTYQFRVASTVGGVDSAYSAPISVTTS